MLPGVPSRTVWTGRNERVLSWPLPGQLDETSLENLLFPSTIPLDAERRNMPPFDYLNKELKRKRVTLQLLWHEYKENNPEGYQYSQFCLRYRAWVKTLDVSLRQDYKAGEKLFVDYAGDTIPIHDPATGETRPAYLFVATLGASNYSYVEAVLSRELPSWISSHIHTFEFLGSVPEIVVPDNPRTGVTHPCRYEPDLNATYQDMALYYQTAVIPARVKKPKDKAKVESAVLITERWIIAALRNHTFFSIGDLNRAIREKLEDFNTRPLQKLKVSRRHLFETIDKPAMKPLPEQRYEYADWERRYGKHRLPCRSGSPLLQCSLPAERQCGRRPHHGDDGGTPLQGQTGGLPSEELSGRQAYDMP